MGTLALMVFTFWFLSLFDFIFVPLIFLGLLYVIASIGLHIIQKVF